jgi:hypothetical protein
MGNAHLAPRSCFAAGKEDEEEDEGDGKEDDDDDDKDEDGYSE